MNHDLMKIAENISKYRKLKGLTQESLAEKLGVSFQAVSKWENGQSCPDILLLPQLADIFDITVDRLLGREAGKLQNCLQDTYFSWPDDKTIRGVVFIGHSILDVCDDMSKFVFKLEGQAEKVISYCNIECTDIQKGASANGNIICSNISGGASAGGNLNSRGSISGGVRAGGNLACQAGISGGVSAGGNLTCGMVTGEVTVKGNMTVQDRIKGNVDCGGNLHCKKIEGGVNCRGSINYKK